MNEIELTTPSKGPYSNVGLDVKDAEGKTIASTFISGVSSSQAEVDARFLSASYSLFQALLTYVVSDACACSSVSSCRRCEGLAALMSAQGMVAEILKPTLNFHASYVEQKALHRHYKAEYDKLVEANRKLLTTINEHIVTLEAQAEKFKSLGHPDRASACGRAISELAYLKQLI
jgi:hypothetical protein